MMKVRSALDFQRVDQLVPDSVAFDMSVYLILMIAVIAERIKHLSEVR